MKSLLNATTWENSSGFGTIGHVLTKKILSGDWQNHVDSPTAKILLAAFASAYKMPEVSWKQIRQLFEFYQHPEDQQKLWVGPLRTLLRQTATRKSHLLKEHLSTLCNKLQIAFQVVDHESGIVDPACKGFDGQKPFAKVSAVCVNGYWQPITDDMSEVHQQQLLWKQGFRHFSEHSFDGILQAARPALDNVPKRFTSPRLYKAINGLHYERMAEICQSQAEHPDPDNGVFLNIDHLLSQKDLSGLLTIFYFKPSTRNYILINALACHHAAFVNDFLKCYQLLPDEGTQTQHWGAQLEKVVPCIYQVDGDDTLLQAIREKDQVDAKKLLLGDVDIYHENKSKVSPLHLACAQEDKAIVEAMVASELRKNAKRNYFRRIAYQGLDLSRQDASGSTPLHYAARGNDPSFAKILFEQEGYLINPTMDFRIPDKQGKTAIHLAAVNPNIEILKSFLKPKTYFMAGHDVQDLMGFTSLHYAVAAKRRDHIRLLLAAGASKTIRAYPDKVKNEFPQLNEQLTDLSPLWIALEQQDLDSAVLLIANANHLWNTKNSQGFNAVQMAAMQGRLDLLKAWDQQFLNSNILYSPDNRGIRLIHCAAMGGHLDVVKFLMNKNERLTRIDKHWNTALHFAAQYGHLAVVQFLLEEVKREKLHNLRREYEGGLREFFGKKRILIQIDSENDFGETPYVLAQINGHEQVAAALSAAGAKTVSLSDHIISAIDRSEKDVERSEYKAAGIASKYHSIAFKKDNHQDTMIHRAVKHLNYRMLMVLFHPLTDVERKRIVQTKNPVGQTPLELIKELRKGTQDKQVLIQLDKMERALIWYDNEAYQRKYSTVAQKTQYRANCAVDFKFELERARTYSYYTFASVYGRPIIAGLQVVAATANPVSFIFAAGGALLGNDPIEVAERSLSMLSQAKPKFLPGPVKAATNLFWWIGLIRNTTKKAAIEIAKHTSAVVMSQANLERYNSEIKNYLHYIDLLAVPYAVSEDVGRNILSTHLENALGGFESVEMTLHDHGVPTLNELVESAGTAANDLIKNKTGIDVQKEVRNGYGWARENIGSIPSKGAYLLTQLDSILDQLFNDPTVKMQVKEIYAAGIDIYRHAPVQLMVCMEALGAYVNHGQQTDHFVTILSEIAQSLVNNQQDPTTLLADFVLTAPFYKSEHLTDLDRNTLRTQVTTDIQAKKMFSEVLSTVSSASVSMVAQNCVASLTAVNPEIRGYVNEGIRALYTQWFNEPATVQENWSHLQSYLNYGVLSHSAAVSLDHLAKVQVSQGKDYTEVITVLTFNNQHYLKFQQDPQMLAGFETHLRQSLQEVTQAPPEEKTAKLHEVLAKERQYSIDTYVKSLKGGQETTNDYKNILHNKERKFSADGLSEYAAQILVFNSTYYFGNLTPQQKLEMQGFFRGFFNHIQGGKFNEDAVVKNYNRALTFITCGSYMDLVMSGVAVDGNVAQIFSGFNSNEVRAAVAAYEVNAMVADAKGYSPLSFQATFDLYRKFFDQQFASSKDKVESGIRDIVNETLRKQDQTGGNYGLVLDSKTLDQAADFVVQSSKQIGENRWPGTGDAFARTIDDHSKGHANRLLSSLGKNIRIGIKKTGTTVSVGLQTNGSIVIPTLTHVGSGTEVALSNPFATPSLTLTIPERVTTGESSSTALVPITPVLYSPLAVTEKRAPRKRPVAPALLRPIAPRVNEPVTQLIPTYGVGKAKKFDLVPELPESLLTLPQPSNPGAVMTNTDRSFGDRLLSWVGIGNAEANPVAIPLMGMAVGAAAAAAVPAISRNPLDSLRQTMEDFPTEHPAVVAAADSLRTAVYVTTFPSLAKNDTLGLFKKSKQNDKPRLHAPDPDKSYVPAPKELPGFPDAKVAKGTTPYPGGIRKRWKTPDKKILEWDYQHGEIELYDKKGKHLGAYDPNTGNIVKPAKDDRNIKKYL